MVKPSKVFVFNSNLLIFIQFSLTLIFFQLWHFIFFYREIAPFSIFLTLDVWINLIPWRSTKKFGYSLLACAECSLFFVSLLACSMFFSLLCYIQHGLGTPLSGYIHLMGPWDQFEECLFMVPIRAPASPSIDSSF